LGNHASHTTQEQVCQATFHDCVQSLLYNLRLFTRCTQNQRMMISMIDSLSQYFECLDFLDGAKPISGVLHVYSIFVLCVPSRPPAQKSLFIPR
jgi:hypothetical protein